MSAAAVNPSTKAAALRREAQGIRATGERLGKVLWVVGGAALVFTAATVTQFAIANKVPREIAWLLDPMVSLALLVVLVGDAVLARHGQRMGGWSTVVKFGAGIATWAMNVWSSVAAADPAGIVLHSVPPALVIGLAEVTPRLRVKFAQLADDLDHQAAVLEDPRLGRPTWAPSIGDVEVEHVAVAELTTGPTPTVALTGPTDAPILSPTAAPTGAPTGRVDSPTDTSTAAPTQSTQSARPTPRPGRADPTTQSARPTPRPGRADPTTQSARPARSGRPDSPSQSTSGSGVDRRSLDQLRADLAAAIKAGSLPVAPSEREVREALKIGAARARILRDEAQAAAQPPTAVAEPTEPVLAAVERREQAEEVAA